MSSRARGRINVVGVKVNADGDQFIFLVKETSIQDISSGYRYSYKNRFLQQGSLLLLVGRSRMLLRLLLCHLTFS